MRITDIPTRLDDTIAIAALFQAILSMLWRLRTENQRWRVYPRMLVGENRWRAQRHGFDQGLVDFGKGEIVPFPALLEELIALTAPDAARLGSAAEIAGTREIVARGTSAHRQLAIHREATAKGASRADALNAVVDWLIAETVAGL
jgi:carboxylate-amine ligase